MTASATTPAATPPAIAAVFDDDDDPLPDFDEEPELERPEVAEEGDPAVVLVACGPPAPAADAEVALEAEINEPGPTSGESPTPRAATASQRPRAALLESMRAQRGTRVPAGTALGNVEGGKVDVQLVLYSGQVIHTAP